MPWRRAVAALCWWARAAIAADDTYTLESEAGAVPRATDLNVSHLALLDPAATVHDGMLYVLAATTSEPYRVFAATPVDDLWSRRRRRTG